MRAPDLDKCEFQFNGDVVTPEPDDLLETDDGTIYIFEYNIDAGRHEWTETDSWIRDYVKRTRELKIHKKE